MGLSVRAYARHRGVTHVAVLKAITAGRIARDPDGTIDPAKADAAWEAESDPAKRPRSNAKPATANPPPPVASQPAPVGGAFAAPPGTSFSQAKTMHEIAKAQRARIQVQRLKDEVIDRARALAVVFRLARQERDAWVNWPARVAAQMAVELGTDPHRMQKVLEAHVRDHLAELADIRPEFR
jgi:hypothetical protein